MNLSRIALGTAAAVMALAPTAAFSATDTGRLSAELNIPHMCEIGGNYHMDLTENVTPGQNNVRRADAGAITVAQNGATTWTLTELSVDSQPNASVLNWGTGIGVDFQDRGSSPMNLGPTNADHLVANVNDSGRREISYEGAFSGTATVMANIDEDARTYSPISGTEVAAPLLGGERYLISTRLRCTAQQFN